MASGRLEGGAGAVAEAYDQAVVWVAASLGASEPTLHVHSGLLIFVLAWWLSKKPLRSGWPLAVVIAAALLNELLDYLHQGLRWREACLDVLLTISWPIIITMVARVKR